MARLTFDEIVTQGGLIGGNDSVSTWIATKLKAWLRKHYAAWPWPFLITQATGISYTSAQATGKIVGGGDGGITNQITRIFSPIYWRGDSYSSRGVAAVRPIVGDKTEFAIGNVDAASQVGPPTSFIVLPTMESDAKLKMTLVAYPVPDKTYTLAFTYQKLPEDPAGTDVPIYPNEQTLIQAAKCAAIEYDNSNTDWFRTESDTLAQMVAADRSTYGATPSFGDVMQLDSSVFLP